MDDSVIHQVAEWFTESEFSVVFTGAGISTESGIPDFRSPGGVWARNRQVLFDEFLASAQARHEYWRQKSQAHDDMDRAEPNIGHRVLARWETAGRLHGVITQNIDGLHQAAGSDRVLELHGTARQVMCLDCEARFEAGPLVAQFRETGSVPACPRCGGRMKHATVSFGQMLSQDVISQAMEWSRKADVMLAAGSSLVVTPAADLPRLAKQSGARLVIINRVETGLDATADVVIHAPLGAALEAIDQRVPF